MGLKTRFIQWLVSAINQEQSLIGPSVASLGKCIVNVGCTVDGLQFTVMPARGGTIVQIRYYDRTHDRDTNTTYVIRDDEDVAVEIGRIVSMELFKQL